MLRIIRLEVSILITCELILCVYEKSYCVWCFSGGRKAWYLVPAEEQSKLRLLLEELAPGLVGLLPDYHRLQPLIDPMVLMERGIKVSDVMLSLTDLMNQFCFRCTC